MYRAWGGSKLGAHMSPERYDQNIVNCLRALETVKPYHNLTSRSAPNHRENLLTAAMSVVDFDRVSR